MAGVDSVPKEAASHSILPERLWRNFEIIARTDLDLSGCTGDASHWDVLVDLYTNEEGAGDFVLSACVTDAGHGFRIVIRMVYVA